MTYLFDYIKDRVDLITYPVPPEECEECVVVCDGAVKYFYILRKE